jgi:hypothetical protein
MMDGVDLAHEATRLHGGLKALLTSSFPGVRGVGQRALDCPFPMLNKPYRHDELAQAIRGILDRRGDPPLVTAAPGERTKSEQRTDRRHGAGVTMRVLVFDDDDAVGRLEVMVATMSGMEATAVTDATVFADRLRNSPPQVVVLDLQLNGTDGVSGASHGDLGYRGKRLAETGQVRGIPGDAFARGRNRQFIPAGICWVVERSFAWLSRSRPLNTIFKRSKEHFIAFVAIAFISIVSRCLKRLVVEELSA